MQSHQDSAPPQRRAPQHCNCALISHTIQTNLSMILHQRLKAITPLLPAFLEIRQWCPSQSPTLLLRRWSRPKFHTPCGNWRRCRVRRRCRSTGPGFLRRGGWAEWRQSYLQMQKFIIVDIDADREVESLVSLVDDFEVVELSHPIITSMKSVCFESLPTIIRWISDCRRIFSFSS